MKIVVKIGTNILTTQEGKLDLNTLRSLIHQLCEALFERNNQVIIVTSGAITCGSERMGLRTQSIPEKQAAASVGQILLMNEYASFFGQKGFQVGQILLTKDCIETPVKRQNTQNTIATLLTQGVVPIINENDTVATDEIGVKFGDNDELSSKVAQLVDADKLIILTDIDGVFTGNPKKDPQARLMHRIETITDDIFNQVDDIQNNRSRGGMSSKLTYAREAAQAGIDVVIANGKTKNILNAILANETVGTFIPAKPLSSRHSRPGENAPEV